MMTKIFSVICFTCLSITLIAQENDTINLPSDKVEVLKNYEAIILQAQRKSIGVEKRNLSFSPVAFSYSNKIPKSIDFDRPDPVIRALGFNMKAKESQDIKDGNIYGGYGNLKTLNAGAAYHYYIEDWIEAGFKVDHFSAEDPDFDFQKFRNTDAHLYGGYYLSPFTKVKLSANGSFQKHHTEGSMISDSLFSSQSLNGLGAKLDFTHTSFEKIGFVMRSFFSYDNLKQKEDDVSENLMSAGISILKKLNEKVAIEIPFVYESYKLNKTASELTNNLIQIRPTIRIKNPKFNAKLGAQYVKNSDNSNINPILSVDVAHVFNEVNMSLTIDTKFQMNSLHSLSNVNPYYLSNEIILLPSQEHNYSLGLNRDFDRLTADLSIAYVNYDSTYNIKYIEPSKRFTADYVDRSELNLKLGLSYDLSDYVSARLQGLRRNFLEDDFIPRYIPNWEFEFGITALSSNKKFVASLDIKHIGSRKYSDIIQEPDSRLDAYQDLSVSIDYAINKHFGVYAKATNLLSPESAAIWFGHPILGRQFWGGIRFNI